MTTPAAWLMIAVSCVVVYAAFPGRYNVTFLPEFVGTFGIPFALVFTGFQYFVAVSFKKPRVIWLVTVLFLAGAILGAIGRAIDLHGFFAEHNISYLEYILCAGSCASGLGLGIAIVRGWAYEDV